MLLTGRVAGRDDDVGNVAWDEKLRHDRCVT